MDEFIHPFNVFLLSNYYVSVTVSESMEQIKPTFKKKVLLNIVCCDQSHGGSKGDHKRGRQGWKEKPMLERASWQVSLGGIGTETSVSHVRSRGRAFQGRWYTVGSE